MIRSLPLLLIAASAHALFGGDRLGKAADSVIARAITVEEMSDGPVAVLPFQSPDGSVSLLAKRLSERVTEGLLKAPDVRVVDRAYLSRIMQEISLGSVGLADSRSAARVGKFSGAKTLVVGQITPKGKKKVIIGYRIVRTESAELLAAGRYELKLDKDLRSLHARKAEEDPLLSALSTESGVREGALFMDRKGSGGCRWIESRVSVPVRAGMDAARAEAISQARMQAVSRLYGKSGGLPADPQGQDLEGRLEAVLRATRPSRIESERLVREEPEGGRLRLTLEACLKTPRKGAKDLRVELMLNQKRFREGEAARAVVTASADAYLHILSVDFEGRIYPVFPVAGLSHRRQKGGVPFVFPADEHEEAGVSLEAALPEGQTRSVEMLRALATEGDARSIVEGSKTYAEVVKALDEAGFAWAEDVRVFTVSFP